MYLAEDKLKEYRNRWLEHLQRMDDTKMTEEAFHCTPRGRRDGKLKA
jgi:transcription initiation factor IIE alpha subunit